MRGMIVAGEDKRLESFERLGAHARGRHIELCGPHNRVEDELAEIRVPPIRVKVAARKAKATSAVRAFDRPTDREIVRFPRRTRDHNGLEARIILPEAKAI